MVFPRHFVQQQLRMCAFHYDDVRLHLRRVHFFLVSLRRSFSGPYYGIVPSVRRSVCLSVRLGPSAQNGSSYRSQMWKTKAAPV